MAGRYELVGANELMVAGPDLEDLLGAYELIGRARGNSPAHRPYGAGPTRHGRATNAAARVAQNSTVVQEKEPTKSRRHYLPMNSNGTVASLASSPISTQPQTLAFRPERVVVPASIAPDFTIDSIFCGIKPQFVATGAIAAETFTQDARDVDMHMDTVNTSQNFTLNVTNQSGAPRQFRATVFGITADD